MKSIKNKLTEATNLALDIAYNKSDEVVDTDELYGKEVSDKIWIYVDRLAHKRLFNLIEGKCSLSESLKFNLYDEEKYLDKIILLFKEIKNGQHRV